MIDDDDRDSIGPQMALLNTAGRARHIYTVCVEPGCNALVTKGARCGAHAREPWGPQQEFRRQTYGTVRWRRVSEAWRQRFPRCAVCGSTEDLQVDHVDPHGGDVARFWEAVDALRLQTLCRGCHVRKHARK